MFGDSQLIIKYVFDEYHIKYDKLFPYKEMVDKMKEQFTKIQLTQIPWLYIKADNIMTTIIWILDILQEDSLYQFLVEQLHNLAYENDESLMVYILVSHQSPWYHEIHAYLKDGIISPILQNTIVENTIYHWGYQNTLSRCLDSYKAVVALKEVHVGIFGSHTSGMVLAKKILRARYYWPLLEHYACELVKRCLLC